MLLEEELGGHRRLGARPRVLGAQAEQGLRGGEQRRHVPVHRAGEVAAVQLADREQHLMPHRAPVHRRQPGLERHVRRVARRLRRRPRNSRSSAGPSSCQAPGVGGVHRVVPRIGVRLPGAVHQRVPRQELPGGRVVVPGPQILEARLLVRVLPRVAEGGVGGAARRRRPPAVGVVTVAVYDRPRAVQQAADAAQVVLQVVLRVPRAAHLLDRRASRTGSFTTLVSPC